MTGAAVDEEDELLLDFCRLAGGEVDPLLVAIFLKEGVWSSIFYKPSCFSSLSFYPPNPHP